MHDVPKLFDIIGDSFFNAPHGMCQLSTEDRREHFLAAFKRLNVSYSTVVSALFCLALLRRLTNLAVRMRKALRIFLRRCIGGDIEKIIKVCDMDGTLREKGYKKEQTRSDRVQRNPHLFFQFPFFHPIFIIHLAPSIGGWEYSSFFFYHVLHQYASDAQIATRRLSSNSRF